MKCREKLALDHPDKVSPRYTGGCSLCPHHYDYLKKPDWCDCCDETCAKCWDREIPGTEPTTTYEHDGCRDCKYELMGINDEPCVRCKGITLSGTPEYETRPDLFEPEEAQIEDLVNHPSHYTQGGMETIEEMELIFGTPAVMDYCLLNAWKYRARAPYKGNPEQDMDKSNWYLNKYKELKESIQRAYGK